MNSSLWLHYKQLFSILLISLLYTTFITSIFVLGCVYFNKSSLSYNTASIKGFIKMRICTEVNCIEEYELQGVCSSLVTETRKWIL